MKISLYLGLLGATLVPASVWAQPLAVPPMFIADTARILTPDFVREADLILVARLSPNSRREGALSASRTGLEFIRGDSDNVGRGLVVPSGEKIEGNLPLSINFARFDPARQQYLLLARLEATPELVARVTKLASENQKITVTFSTDKTSYAPDDEIILKWQARNTSPTPQRIYTGPFALQHTAVYDNSGRGTGTGGSHKRAESDYVLLAPDEVWSDTRTIRGPFPQGEVRVKMTLDSNDNFLGSPARRASERPDQKRVEGVALFKAEGSVTVAINAPSPAAQKALAARLSSSDWSEALKAATTLAQLRGASDFAEMRALANHPWSALRRTFATALARDATEFGPQLRALTFDGDSGVRSQTLEAIHKNQVAGAGVAALAVMAVGNEAVEKGFLTDKQRTREAEPAISKVRDGNRDVGDLLAARIEAGRATENGINAPYLLNLLAENQRRTSLGGDKTATSEQEKAILGAWKDAPDDVRPAGLKSRTAAELETEIVAARAAMFDDFNVGPQFGAIVENLRKLDGKAFPKASDESRIFFENLAPAARVDVLHALQWRTGRTSDSLDNLPALKAIAQIEGPHKLAAGNYLLAQIYSALNRDLRQGIYAQDDAAFAAAVALGTRDADFARPHLEMALRSDNQKLALGAAIGLFVGRQKSALPAVFEPKRWDEISWLSSDDLQIALVKTTGLTFKDRVEWKKWWDETGSKMEWK